MNAKNAEFPYFFFFLQRFPEKLSLPSVHGRQWKRHFVYEKIIAGGDTMTDAERREYMRQYRQKNRERIQAQRRKRETRLAVAALENVERVTDDVFIVKTINGETFTLIREKVNA